MEKLCVFCKHCEFDWSAVGGGCETCGYGGEGAAYMRCGKGHWSVDMATYGDEPMIDYRDRILTAQSCSDYRQVKVDGTAQKAESEPDALTDPNPFRGDGMPSMMPHTLCERCGKMKPAAYGGIREPDFCKCAARKP